MPRKAPQWATAPELAAAKGVSYTWLRRQVADAKRHREAHGAWPAWKGVVPAPSTDGPSGGSRQEWDLNRKDVKAWLKPGLVRAVELDDPVWLASQYAKPPAGAGKSAYQIAKENGWHKSTVGVALERHGLVAADDGDLSLETMEAAIAEQGSMLRAAQALGMKSEMTLRSKLRRARAARESTG